MAYIVNLSFRAKGKRDYEHLGNVDIGEPLTSEGEPTIKLPDGREVRVHIDQSHLIPVHGHDTEDPPVIYVTEL
ncbi:MAG TPA: hypothetical protein VGU20_02695 [Stellaceae bacterium]|nr:hypothetical protein [Stellaceae bacterium]